MKKLFTYIICLFAFSNIYSQEWVSASIANTATPNKVGLFIKSTTEFDANKCDNIVFTVRIPKIAGSNITVIPDVASNTFFAHINFAVQKLTVDDGVYYYYLINGTGTVVASTGTIIPINDPRKIIELSFTGGTSDNLVQIANIENDIPGNGLLRPQFYIQINTGDITNYSNMYYGTDGAIPVINQAVTGDDWVGTASIVVLPVKFLSFTAIKKDNNAELAWNVENEGMNTDHYDIERSFNGVNFTKFTTAQPRANNAVRNSYTLIDNNLSSLRSTGIIYYRIKQVDKDSRFVNTEIRSVRLDGKTFDASVYPNPVVNIGSVNIYLSENNKINITVTDATGKLIEQTTISGTAGLNMYQLNMNKLAAGSYYVKVNAGSNNKILAVVKHMN